MRRKKMEEKKLELSMEMFFFPMHAFHAFCIQVQEG